MAQIIVTDTSVNLNVTTTQSNITVTDLETNVTVNVASLSSNIAVTNESVNVVIAPSVGVSNAEIRAALSATTPIVYDNNTGEFTFDPSANNMQVTSLTASSFVTTTGNLTSSGLSVSGNATVSGLLNVANISIAGDLNANLKDISLSYYDAGNVSGNVTLDVANGPVQKIRLTNNLTGLTFTGATAAQPITLIIQQDNVGFWTLDTSTFASNWTNWLFTSNFKTLSTTANANDLLSVTYNGTTYFASLVNFVQTLITNAELANSNVVVNGTTINLGSNGNISHFGALTTTNLPEGTNLYFTTERARGNLSVNDYGGDGSLTYSSANGAFSYIGPNQTEANTRIDARLSATSPIQYSSGVISLSGTANITTTGNISGGYILGNGSQLTGVTTLTNAQVVAHIATVPLTVGGNLTVNGNINATGNINVQNVQDLYVRDQTIVMNANAASPANVQIVSNRPGLANVELKWNEQSDRWTFTNDGTTYYNLATSTTDVAEGTNLYYTTDRANTAIGAYQGNINTAGTITAGALLGDGSNIAYVRAYSADLVTDSGPNGLNVILESQSNNRLAKASSDSFRYVPETRTVLVSDGFIGSSAANTSFSGVNLLLTGNINAGFGNMSVGNISVNTVTAGSLSGNGTLITAITGANVFGLTSTQVSEGTNLYFTTDRANTAIGAYQGSINTPGNITAGNVITASIHSNGSSNITLNSNTALVIKETIKGVSTNVGNINGDGYGLVVRDGFNVANATPIVYSGNSNILSYTATTGAATLGSNVITGITSLLNGRGTSDSISNIILNSLVFSDSFINTYPFPTGTFVTQLDAANSQVFVSQNAIANLTLDAANATFIIFRPGAYDSSTGQSIAFRTSGDLTLGGNASNIIQTVATTDTRYGYPASGFTPSNFDFYSVGTASDYTLTRDISNLFQGRTQFEAPKTVMNLQRGLVVGNGDMTNRGENDPFPNFGVNVIWDGLTPTTDFGNNTPATQILIKNYTDNSAQSSSSFRVNSGPRIFFTAAEGNKNQPYQLTYPRNNFELGRITWFSGAQTTPPGSLSTLAPPAFISVVTNRDMTGSHTGGVGMYLSASPNDNAGRRGLFMAHQLGNTLIASSNTTTTGVSQPITFAPMWTATTAATAGNAVSQFNNTMGATNYQWANVNYDNATSKTGSKLTVTNGISTVAGRNGNLTLSLDRNDNGAGFGSKEWAFKLRSGQTDLVLTEDDVIRTTFAGGNITASYFIGDGSQLTNVAASVSGSENITVTGNVISLKNALGNVNSVSTETASNLTLATNKQITVTTRQRNNALASSANIVGEGFALTQGFNFYNAPFMSYNGTSELKTLAFDGTTTAGSNVITGVANVRDLQGNPLTIGNILPQYAFCDLPVGAIATIFPAGTYVVSVSGSNVYMSANALLSETLAYDGGDPYNSIGALSPAMRDSTTGLQIILESDFDDGGANAQLITYNFMTDNKLRYGYGNSGPITTDFTYAVGTASDYAIDTNVMSPFLIGRTNFSANKTVGNFRRGLTVGDADLTNRGENDGIQTFGLNVLWDGTVDPNTEYGSDTVFPQMLIKQYTDGTNQAFGGEGLTNGGPRLLFVSANGKNTDQPLSTYARANQEIGRITWLSSTSQTVTPSSVATPAFISVVSNRDQTGSAPNDFGMYLVASANPNNANKTLWAAQHKANTVISAGSRGGTTSGDIYFAPAREANTGNAVLLAERITDSAQGSPHWAKIGYDNPTSNTGAKVSVTNGFNTAAGRNGNISLVLDRNDNGAGFGNKEWALKLQSGSNNLVLTEDDVVRTTFSAGTVTATAFVGDGSDLTDVRAQTVEEKVINKSGGTLAKGTPVFATGGVTADVLHVAACDAGNAATMPCVGILATSLANDAEGRAIVIGKISGVDTSAFAAGDQLYVAVGGGYANVAPTGENTTIQGLGVVTRVNASQGGGIVNVVAENLTPNLNNGNVFIGNSSNVAVSKSLVTAITDANVKLKQYSETRVDLGSTGGNITLDMANGSIFAMTATSNISNIALANASVGSSGTLIITQDGTGGETLTTTSAWKFASGSKTLSTAANAIDVISFFTDGTTVYAALSKGYA
jgi:hypothetical protein